MTGSALEKLDKFEQFITINQKLLLEVKVGDYPGIFDSRIEDIVKGKNQIMVSMPTDRGQTVPLRPNTRLHVSYVMDRGRFSFKSLVLDRIMDPLPMLVITYPDAVFRQELRSFFRVDTRIPVKLMVNTKTGEGIMSQKIVEAKAVDISGGGLRLFSEIKAEKDDIIEIYFLGAIDKLEMAKGQVMRCQKREDMYELGIKFLDLGQSDRDKVIKYVFKRQVELRKLIG